ncbi:MAG: poly-beta-1,6-N-acetyl-D-glucosamine synthase [Bacillota bacterium]|nr:poly-beta-1,6-N-acetyl-D-glucosamine synthase [Bacillota bacterium]
MENLLKIMSAYVFWYPLIMSMIWIVGGLLFYVRIERLPDLDLEKSPKVSILVPCYNEQSTIFETIKQLDKLNYEDYEIIAINDGSRDNTVEKLKELSLLYKRLRIIDLKKNSGKANALFLGLIASKGEIIVGIDADAFLDEDALKYIVPHFTTSNYGERVGAVTGNPRVRNRSSLLAKVQLCEFSSIIGLIKRSQRMLGKVMTVSGVVAAYRKSALLDCGMWDRDTITEDIGVTWKLQKRFWDIRYEPRAVCWMLAPETLKGYWKQRVRWAQGGIEALLKHWDIFFDWRQRRLTPIYLEQVFSILWSVSWLVTVTVYFLYYLRIKALTYPVFWSGEYLTLICVIQFLIAMFMDSRYDRSILRYYLWAIWYPTFYWYFNALVIIRAIPKAIFKNKNRSFAVWESPDRGIGSSDN